MKINKSGFTLVELLIVIIVIGILSGIVLVTYNGLQARARDARRIADLQNIAEAIGSYRTKYGNDVSTGSGCGLNGNGNEWFNLQDATHPKSILTCLTEKGYLSGSVIDPYNCTTTTDASASCKKQGYAYMKYTSGSGDTSVTCIYARLEASGSTSDLTDSSNPCYSASSSTVATSYGMNYYQLVK